MVAKFTFTLLLQKGGKYMSEPVVHSHWHQSISGLSITSTEFYEAVGKAIEAKNIPGMKIEGKYYAEGMIGSAQRLYLRAKRNEYYFDICGAPSGLKARSASKMFPEGR
jgi:hypothetical protein